MEPPTYSPNNPPNRSRFGLERVLLPLVIAVIVIMVLADNSPMLNDAREKLLHPVEYQARQACHAAALAAAAHPAYARIRAAGTVYATQGASFVEGVDVGEMGETGAEVTYRFSCYVDPDGKVVKTSKQP